MSMFLPLCLVTLTALRSVDSYSSGAPSPYCGSTGTMQPGHGNPPGPAQPSNSIPYTLKTISGQTTYSTGETITLSLDGDGTEFTGFLIQALSSAGTIVGTMVAPDAGSRVMFCGGDGFNGITHTNSNPKTTFNFQWVGPDTATSGAVTFLVTVVQDFSTYWVREFMLLLNSDTAATTIQTGSGQTTGSEATVTPLPQTTVVSSSTGTILTTKPPQVTSNNQLIFANTDVIRTGTFMPVTTAHFNDAIAPITDLDENKHKVSVGENNSVIAFANMNAALINSSIDTNTSEFYKNSAYFSENSSSFQNASTNSVNTDTNLYPASETDRYRTGVNYNDAYEATPPSDSTRNQYPISHTNPVDYHKVTYSTGRYETLDHRAKDVNPDILPAEVGAMNVENASRNMFDIPLNNTIMPLDEVKFYFDRQTNTSEDMELNKWDSNLGNDTLDSFTNSTRLNIFEETKNKSNVIKTREETISESLKVTELPLSDPDLIFNVAKRILTKDNTHFKQVVVNRELAKRKHALNDTLVKESTPSTIGIVTENFRPIVTRQSLDNDVLVNDATENSSSASESGRFSLEMRTETFDGNSAAGITSSRFVDNQLSSKHHQTSLPQWYLSTNLPETLSPQWDLSTNFPKTPSPQLDLSTNLPKTPSPQLNLSTKLPQTSSPWVLPTKNSHTSSPQWKLPTEISKTSSPKWDSSNKLPNSKLSKTSSSQWDSSTTQPTVTIQSSMSTLKEIVSEWTREHVHDIPDPIVSTTVKEESRTRETSALPSSEVNSTHLNNLLDSDIPITEGGRIEYDPQCGVTKGCFVDCSGNDCKFQVTWRDLGTAIQFELYGKPDRSFSDAWVAVGFSSDIAMGDDSVTECVYSNGMLQAFSSYTTGYSNPRRLNPAKIGLSNVVGYYYDGVLFCSFVRQKNIPQVMGFFDLEQDWHIMFAHGKVLQVPAWELYMHSLTEPPPASAAKVDYQSVVVIGSAAKFKLVKAHGCLMIFAWVLFTGIGIVVARYYKSVWGDKTFFKLKIWFQIHRACMVSALVLNMLAFILIFIEVKGYSAIPDIPGKGYLRSHPVLGIIVTVLCLANPVMAFFRPGGDHKNRPLFNWAHWGVGMAAYILSAICICFGFQLGKSSTPDYAIYIMIVYVIYVIIFDVVFEVMECISNKEKKGIFNSIYDNLDWTSRNRYTVSTPDVKVDGMEMNTRNGTDNGTIPNGNHVTKDTIKKKDKIKTMLLALHIAFTGAFALVLVLVVALN